MSALLAIPDLTSLDKIGEDLLPMLNALREDDPVVWNPSVHAWMLLRHQDVLDGYQGKFPLSSEALNPAVFSRVVPLEEQMARIPNIVTRVPKWVVNADPPYHQRIRTVMMKGFSPRIIEGMRPFVVSIINEVMDRVDGQSECDLVALMRVITVRTIMRLVGIPADDFDDVERWSEAITASFTRPFFTAETLELTDNAFGEMREILLREIVQRRSEPKDDFLTHLVVAADNGREMTDEELVSQLVFLLPAGHDSTTNTMVLGLVALMRDRDMWNDFANSPENLARNVVELMRYVAMSSVSNRIATEDFELHGKTIRKGEMVLLVIASANRDPRAFPQPERLDPSRNNQQQLAFGNGIHHCIGHLLAKLEIGELLSAVLGRFPDMAMRDEELVFSTALAFRGLEHMWVYPHGRPDAAS